MLDMKARDIMTTQVITARKDTSLSEVIQLLLKGPFSGLPVINEKHEAIGIVTELDVLRAISDGSDGRCENVMTKNPITIEADSMVYEALRLLIKHNIIRLPVTAGGRLVGILSRRDILRAVSGGAADGELAFIMQTLKALLAARHHAEMLRVLAVRMAEYFESGRCSIVRVDTVKNKAVVLAAHDDENMTSLEIDLVKYPEIREACRTGEPVVIYDALEDPLMQPVREHIRHLKSKSILVFPVISRDRVVGTLHLRTHTKRQFSLKEIKVVGMLAVIASDIIKMIMREERLRRLYADVEKKAVVDDLTGLYNRRLLKVRLEEEFTMASRHALPLSCIMFDIDRFKDVNDALGHEEGDRVLRRFAQRLRRTVRVSDFVVRYGGEEFLLILPMTDSEGALKEASRIKENLDNIETGTSISLTVSVGVACHPNPGIKRSEDLVKQADLAMYEAKRAGRNRIAAFGGGYVSTK